MDDKSDHVTAVASSPATPDLENPAATGDDTRRGLKGRHLSMLAVGGTIGTGLFLISGATISTAGPVGAVFAFIIAGIFVYFVVATIGEMATICKCSIFQ